MPVELHQIEALTEFRDFTPSWQNSFEAIGQNHEAFKIFGTYLDQELAGYCVFEPVSGDIIQIAVTRMYRRRELPLLY